MEEIIQFALNIGDSTDMLLDFYRNTSLEFNEFQEKYQESFNKATISITNRHKNDMDTLKLERMIDKIDNEIKLISRNVYGKRESIAFEKKNYEEFCNQFDDRSELMKFLKQDNLLDNNKETIILNSGKNPEVQNKLSCVENNLKICDSNTLIHNSDNKEIENLKIDLNNKFVGITFENENKNCMINNVINQISKALQEKLKIEDENINLLQDYIEEDMENFSKLQELEEENEIKRMKNISIFAKIKQLTNGKRDSMKNVFNNNLLSSNKENNDYSLKNTLIKNDISKLKKDYSIKVSELENQFEKLKETLKKTEISKAKKISILKNKLLILKKK